MIALTLIFAASSGPCDRLPEAQRLLEELRTEEALEFVASMRDDRRCPAAKRSMAWMLSAEAWFALGEDPSARYSAEKAFELDSLAKTLGAVPEVLADLIEDQRQFQVGDTLSAQDRSGTLVDLSLTLPLKVYVPTGQEPLIEARVDGNWRALTPRKVPGTSGRVFGAALPRKMLDSESISFRFIVGGQTLGPFQRKTAREMKAPQAKQGVGLWVWVGAGAAVGIGAAAVLLLAEEPAGCQPREGTACIQLQVRP